MNIGKDLTPTSTQPATIHVPVATEDVRAIDVEMVAQNLYNYCRSLYDGKIVVASGVTMSVDSAGLFTCNGTATFAGIGSKKTIIAQEDVTVSHIDALTARLVTVNETITLGSTAELTAPIGSNVAVLGRSQKRPRVHLADVASVTIDTTQADEFVLPNAPIAVGAPPGNIIKLRTTTFPIPHEDERITLVVPDMFDALTGGVKYTIKREDGTVICAFYFVGAGWHASISADFVFDGGVWRLSKNSGRSLSSGSSPVDYGVFPDDDGA